MKRSYLLALRFDLLKIFCILFIVFASLSSADTVFAQTTYFIHSDHLSSTTIITKDGTVVDRKLYYPFGTERNLRSDNQQLITERTFTGQTLDTPDTGLMYYNARYYNPQIARFSQ